MKRASISIDFLFSLVVALSILVLFFPLAYMQLEDMMVLNFQQKAESMSMGVGSAVNHFHAIEGTQMTLDLRNPVDGSMGGPLSGTSLPPGRVLNPVSCKVELNSSRNFVLTNISYIRKETNQEESITAKFPALVDQVEIKGDKKVFECGEDTIELGGSS